jgi:ABC-2 type transport system permease protein
MYSTSAQAPAEVPARVALPLLARLKLTLLKRHFQRNHLGAVGMVIVLGIFSIVFLVTAVILAGLSRSSGPQLRDMLFSWTAWIFTLLWLSAPLSQFDTQRNLDLAALRLQPLSGGTFTWVVLLDALVSPQALAFVPPLLVLTWGFAQTAAELPLVLVSMALLLATNVALGQAVLLYVSRLLSSRRFTDLSMVLGVLFIFVFQGLNLAIHSGENYDVPLWLRSLFQQAGVILRPVLEWTYPGLAAGVVRAAATGDALGSALRATLLAGQALLAFALAGRAARAFYEGELESGGTARRRRAARQARGWVHGALGALFNRERIYVYRDPLLKSLFLQSVVSVAYFSLLSIFMATRGERTWNVPHQFLLLGITMLLAYVESYLLFNKLGLEGPQLSHTLLAPVSRRTLLQAKSLFLLTHFLGLNLLIVAGLGIALGVAPLYIVAAALVLCSSMAVIDLAGHFVSIYFPHSYRKRGRTFRPLYAQSGCGYFLVYGLATQACNMAALPVAAVIVLGALNYGWAGLAAGALLAGGVVAAGYVWLLPLAARLLEQREPEIIAAASREPD